MDSDNIITKLTFNNNIYKIRDEESFNRLNDLENSIDQKIVSMEVDLSNETLSLSTKK